MANIQDLLGEAYHEGMTNDEIVEALQGVSLPQDRSDEVERLKKAFDKSASETAEYKRQLRAKQTEEEKKQAELNEKFSLMEKENAEMKKQIAVADLTNKFLASGLDNETARKTALAAYDGKIDTIIDAYNAKIASVKDTVKAELMADTPSITGGNATQVKDFSTDINGAITVGDYANAAALVRTSQTQNTNI